MPSAPSAGRRNARGSARTRARHCGRSRGGGERVHLNRVVDHELGGQERVDLLRVAAQVVHRVAHRGQVDDRGHAGEVPVEHPRGV